MRITTQMQNNSTLQMQSSEYYKKATGTSDDDSKNKTSDEISIGNNLTVKRDEDTLIISKIGKNKSSEILQEIPLDSEKGAVLNEYINSNYAEESKTELEKVLDEINTANRTMSLVNYL